MYYSTADYGYGSDKGAGVEIGLNVSLDTKFYHKAVVDTADGAPLPGQATGRLIAFDPLTKATTPATHASHPAGVDYQTALMAKAAEMTCPAHIPALTAEPMGSAVRAGLRLQLPS